MVKDSHKILQRLNELLLKKKMKTAEKKELDIIDTLEVCYEMTCRGYKITNINLEKSLAKDFLVNPDNHKEIIPPFIVVDGLGEAVANKIVQEREKPFTSIQDMMDRTSLPKPIFKKLEEMGVFKAMENDDIKRAFDNAVNAYDKVKDVVTDYFEKPEVQKNIDKAKDITIDVAEKGVAALKKWLKSNKKGK